jgi:hypothetical protein
MTITIGAWIVPLMVTIAIWVLALPRWPGDDGDRLGFFMFVRLVLALIATLVCWLLFFAVT